MITQLWRNPLAFLLPLSDSPLLPFHFPFTYLETLLGVIGVSEHMGWVRNVVLMNVYFGSGKPQGVRISGRGGVRWADGGNARVSLRATQGRSGRILSQQGGFQVSGKGTREQGGQEE